MSFNTDGSFNTNEDQIILDEELCECMAPLHRDPHFGDLTHEGPCSYIDNKWES